MSCYQKFYSNQIHSSSLMCQLATMWKSQVLCDAIIRTGSIITKAHRLVLVAACPMLQSMENASMGSHLEVRLAPDIKQDSVNTFLQYLYEGFMMLTEENCKDVEKIARLLQVDSIIKCVSDFYKCLSAKTGCHIDDRYKYSSYDLLEFKHIRASSIQKTLHEAALKRGSDFSRPLSPGNKRQRLHRPPSPSDSRLSHRADDTHSMAHSYTQGGQLRDPWDARGRGGARVPPQPGVIDIVEDSIEIIQSDQSDKADGHVKQKSVSVGVTSQYNTATDVRVVSVNDSGGTGTLHSSGAKTHDSQQSTITNSSARGSITVSPLPMFDTSSSPTSVNRNSDSQMDIPSVRPTPPSQPVFPTLTPMPKQPVPILPKPFAAGSASQASSSPSSEAKSSSPANVDHTEKREMANKDDVTSEDGTTPDLKIVKIESNDSLTGGLDMYVDRGEDNILRLQGMEDCQNEDGSDVEHDQSLDWSKEEMSNEGSNVSTDQNNSWYIDQFKEPTAIGTSPHTRMLTPTVRRRGRKPRAHTIQRLEVPSVFKVRRNNQVNFGPDITSENRALPSAGEESNQLSEQNVSTSLVSQQSGTFGENILDFTSHPASAHDTQNTFRAIPDLTNFISRYSSDAQWAPPSNVRSEEHRITQTEGSKYKPCVLCQINKVKTKSGWYVYTYYRCEQCDVPLCKGRGCFVQYHKTFVPANIANP